MKRILLIFLIGILIISCKHNEEPEIDMPDDDIVALIQDMHISNAAIRKYKNEERDSVGQIFRRELSEIHGVSEEKIDFVLEQIQRYPKKYLELEKQAVKNLKSLKDSLKTTPIIKSESKPVKEKKR